MTLPQEIPDPEKIRRTAAKILSGPDFQIEQDTKVGHALVDLFYKIIEWILTPFRWLFDQMEWLPNPIRWLIVIGLLLIVLLLLGHIVYSIMTTLGPIKRKSNFLSNNPSDPQLHADQFEQLAKQAFAERDYIAAVRLLFRASLSHLQDMEGRRLSPGITNRQCLQRYRQRPFVESLQAFVDIIDASWYGSRACQQEEYFVCRDAYAEIRRQTQTRSHADRA